MAGRRKSPDSPVTSRKPAGGAPRVGAVRRVLVSADFGKPPVVELMDRLRPWLAERVEVVELAEDVRDPWGVGESPEGLPDLVVVLGGDGAMLSAARAFSEHPVPTVGINFGRVGFLASVPAGRWEPALEEILGGRGVHEPRMRLAARLEQGGSPARSGVALNDVMVARQRPHGLLVASLRIDGQWVADYRADGLIAATASGSTAHSLSAGGPILAPHMAGIVLTPICPQGLSHRPIVLHPDSSLEIELVDSPAGATLIVDGQGSLPMEPGDRVTLERHPVDYPMLAWRELDPYRRLRNRLGWTGRRASESPRERGR